MAQNKNISFKKLRQMLNEAMTVTVSILDWVTFTITDPGAYTYSNVVLSGEFLTIGMTNKLKLSESHHELLLLPEGNIVEVYERDEYVASLSIALPQWTWQPDGQGSIARVDALYRCTVSPTFAYDTEYSFHDWRIMHGKQILDQGSALNKYAAQKTCERAYYRLFNRVGKTP